MADKMKCQFCGYTGNEGEFDLNKRSLFLGSGPNKFGKITNGVEVVCRNMDHCLREVLLELIQKVYDADKAAEPTILEGKEFKLAGRPLHLPANPQGVRTRKKK